MGGIFNTDRFPSDFLSEQGGMPQFLFVIKTHSGSIASKEHVRNRIQSKYNYMVLKATLYYIIGYF
jgi:hypothetical protein